MTAGRGITHSERFEQARAEGGPMHGIQAWVALPLEYEETEPAFSHHGPADLPTFEAKGLWARLVAGEGFGARAKVKTYSPMFYAHWRLDAGRRSLTGPRAGGDLSNPGTTQRLFASCGSLAGWQDRERIRDPIHQLGSLPSRSVSWRLASM